MKKLLLVVCTVPVLMLSGCSSSPFDNSLTIADQNIYNLKYIFQTDANGQKTEQWVKTENIIKRAYPNGNKRYNHDKYE